MRRRNQAAKRLSGQAGKRHHVFPLGLWASKLRLCVVDYRAADARQPLDLPDG